MAVKALQFIHAVARKLLAKPPKPSEGLTSIANRMQAEAKAGEIAETFRASGLTPDKWDDFIKSEKDVIKFLNIIESSKPVTKEVSKDLIKAPGKKADVLDLTGKKIDTTKPILGGKNVPETEAHIKAKIDAMNKKTVASIRQKKYEAAVKAEEAKAAADEDYIMKVFDPEDFAGGGIAGMLGEPTYADGGRTGFAGGKLAFDAARRLFLKLTGGAVAGTMAAKSGLFGLLKGGAKKAVIKDLTSVPIKDISGMPVWFKPLVNKVIKEGDDVTKKLATKEREIVHTKKLDEFDEVTVTQDLDTGNVRVEYHGSGNMGEAPIQLDYKAGEVIEPTISKTGKVTKGTTTKSEFSAVESEPEIVNWDGDIEWSGENVVNKVDDLLTDTTKLETYATGKNPTIKKLLKSEQKQKYVNKLHDDQMEQINFIENKHGPGMDYIDEGARVGDFDPKGYRNLDTKGMNLPDKTKKASGGRVSLSAGGLAGMLGE